jgi:hypothetical protein
MRLREGSVKTASWQSLAVLGWLVAGCVPRNHELAAAVAETYQLNCPVDRVRVLSHRKVGFDELWAVDACGVEVELEKGLEFSSDRSQLQNLSAADLEQIRENLKPDPSESDPARMPLDVRQAGPAKATELCVLGSPDSISGIAIPNQTIAEQSACQQRLAATTDALGAERDEQGTVWYWFRVGSWAIRAVISYHAPPCARLTLTNTSVYCDCASDAAARARCEGMVSASRAKAVANRHSSGKRSAQSRPLQLFARAGLGLGHLASSGDTLPSLGTAAVAADIWGGLLFHPRLGVGVGLVSDYGLSSDSVDFNDGSYLGTADVRSELIAAAVLLSAMPFSVPLRFDAQFGYGGLTRASPLGRFGESKSTGVYLGGGIGVETKGEYVDLGFTGNVHHLTASDGPESIQATGYGVMLNIWTHARAPRDPTADDEK